MKIKIFDFPTQNSVRYHFVPHVCDSMHNDRNWEGRYHFGSERAIKQQILLAKLMTRRDSGHPIHLFLSKILRFCRVSCEPSVGENFTIISRISMFKPMPKWPSLVPVSVQFIYSLST